MNNVNIPISWIEIKNLINSLGIKLHYVEDSVQYRIFCLNGSILYETYLFKDSGSLVLENATQNDLDLADFENNYKANANTLEKVLVKAEFESNQDINISGQSISNTLRIVQISQNQDLVNGSYTEIYNYSGSGSIFGLFTETTTDNILIKIEVDGEIIIDGILLSDIPVVGPGSSGNGPELSTGLWRSSINELNYKPPLGIKYNSSISIKLQSNLSNKKLANGFISLSKVT